MTYTVTAKRPGNEDRTLAGIETLSQAQIIAEDWRKQGLQDVRIVEVPEPA